MSAITSILPVSAKAATTFTITLDANATTTPITLEREAVV